MDFRKKARKAKKKAKKAAAIMEQPVAVVVAAPVVVPEVDVGPHIDLKSSKIRAPMTKAEYEKQQSTLKWVTDPETGRRR